MQFIPNLSSLIDDLYYDFTDSGQHALILSLGDINPGTYTYSLNLASGTIDEAYVVDYLGDHYGATSSNLTSGNTTHTIQFTLDSAAVGVGLVALTTDRTLQVNYQVNGTVPPLTPSAVVAAPSASSSSISGATSVGALGYRSVGITVVLGVVSLSVLLGVW